MALQKGQVVLLEGNCARASIDGQQAVLLSRDAASGRYRARLVAEPWKTVKINRGQIRTKLDADTPELPASDAGEQDSEETAYVKSVLADRRGALTGEEIPEFEEEKPPLADECLFQKARANCDYCLGAFKKSQRKVLPSHIRNVKSNWPPSPVQRGKMEHLSHKALPRIEKSETYREIQTFAPHDPEDQNEVHRQRRYLFSNFKAADLEQVVGMPTRKPPVQMGMPHRLLAGADSSDLKAIVDRDHQAEYQRKLELSMFQVSLTSHPSVDFAVDDRRDEEMLERLERIEQRHALAKSQMAAGREAYDTAHRDDYLPSYDERGGSSASHHSEHHQEIIKEESSDANESEEQRISREFKEYEIESISHGPSVPSTPLAKDMVSYHIDEGFEEDSPDAAHHGNGEHSDVLMIDVDRMGAEGYNEDSMMSAAAEIDQDLTQAFSEATMVISNSIDLPEATVVSSNSNDFPEAPAEPVDIDPGAMAATVDIDVPESTAEDAEQPVLVSLKTMT